MNQTIANAIRERRLLRITYKGESRDVEPHVYGRQTSGKDALSAWQRSGGSGAGFRLFHLADLSACVELALSFPGPRDGYNRDDKQFAVVIAQL
jgi:hypothetical protein